MGCGSWTPHDWDSYSKSSIAGKSAAGIYTSKMMKAEFDPKDIPVRESRDSADHPSSNAIIIGLDVTGSMSDILEGVAKKLNVLVSEILDRKPVTDPQIMFNAIGDPPATIVYWEDGDKTVVRCDNDVFSEEFGYAMACMRKAYGSRANFKAQFKNAFRPQQKPKKQKKAKEVDQQEPAAALPSPAHNVIGLDKMIKQLAGDDSMGVRVGYRVNLLMNIFSSSKIRNTV